LIGAERASDLELSEEMGSPVLVGVEGVPRRRGGFEHLVDRLQHVQEEQSVGSHRGTASFIT